MLYFFFIVDLTIIRSSFCGGDSRRLSGSCSLSFFLTPKEPGCNVNKMKTSSLSKQEENPILLLRTKLQDTVGDNKYIYIYIFSQA